MLGASGSVVIGIMHDSVMEALMVRDLVRLVRERGEVIGGTIFVQGGAGRLDNARNFIAKQFLATKGEWLLTIDTDMVFFPEDFDQLCATADADTAPIVSGIYFVDEKKARPAAGELKQGHVRSLTDWPEGATLDVEYVGAGFMLIHRSVLEALGPEPYRQDVAAPAGALLGEDYAFCHRSREAGFGIKLNTKVFLGHIKPRVLGWE